MEVAANVTEISRPPPLNSSSISTSNSSMLANSIASPSSSLTSILTNSPISSASGTSSNNDHHINIGTSSSSECPIGPIELASNQAALSSTMGPLAVSETSANLEAAGKQQHQHQLLQQLENESIEIIQHFHHQLNNNSGTVETVKPQTELRSQALLSSQQNLDELAANSKLSDVGDYHHESDIQLLKTKTANLGTPQAFEAAVLAPTLNSEATETLPAVAATTTTVDLLAEGSSYSQASGLVPTTLDLLQLGLQQRLLAADGLAPQCAHSSYSGEPIQAASGSNAELRHPSSAYQLPQTLLPETRLERSNSCSQAECSTISSVEALIGQQPIGSQTISLSHDNLATGTANVLDRSPIDRQNLTNVNNYNGSAKSSFDDSNQLVLDNQLDDNRISELCLANHANNIESNSQSSPKKQQASGNLNVPTDIKNNNQAQTAGAPTSSSYSSAFSSTSARFFSSKLNTGSLWSLLSVGSNSSSVMNDSSQTNESFPGEMEQILNDKQSTSGVHGFNYQNNLKHHQENIMTTKNRTSSSGSSFLSRYQFIRSRSGQQSSVNDSSSSFDQQQPTLSSQKQENLSQTDRKRYRFNVKYIGSALLHRNFTLPMLEWIAKDIRRQTIRGAQSTTQRQFTIPSRDIIFEIQSNQLTAISCKDNHCIFVHPMHCVSKYVQLQHDSTCFAYIIRDTKDSPSFCHVFQAKNVGKVHDIFSAIREATTRTQLSNQHHQQATSIPSADRLMRGPFGVTSINRPLQKSASTDGHWRSLLTSSELKMISDTVACENIVPTTITQTSINATTITATNNSQLNPSSISAPMAGGCDSIVTKTSSTQAQCQAQIQFENSYQFEVMFVKRVKLQCRRVPPSFVDDALETLKSYEVSLKGSHSDSKTAQIKGVGKRIINASVDERQEYDEYCPSPPPQPISRQEQTRRDEQQALADRQQLINHNSDRDQVDQEQRRGSSVSLRFDAHQSGSNEEFRVSKSCQQSPTKVSIEPTRIINNAEQQTLESDLDQNQLQTAVSDDDKNGAGIKLQSTNDLQMKKHQSVDCLKSIDYSLAKVPSDQQASPPAYTNDFSPYSTITSSDLNERIAAIPVVSGNSVSLDHETRQKLARQVRETIMATAANIKRGVYASGDKLDSSSSSKALDSLSCNVISSVPTVDQADDDGQEESSEACRLNGQKSASLEDRETVVDGTKSPANDGANQQQLSSADEHRRSSACVISSILQRHSQQSSQSSGGNNNFDLFRRASARQVVKNRTMLLLIGKDELCAISIDKHQMLFNKSFNSIVHCLQGNNNKDHFGLICRDSGKINPQAESYAGYVFKCQSDKVVREIMGALKQVIYSSQHNYHGYNSPYNPLNSVGLTLNSTQAKQLNHNQQQSPKLDRISSSPASGSIEHSQQIIGLKHSNQASQNAAQTVQNSSLAIKRGFGNPIGVDEASRLASSSRIEGCLSATSPPTAPAVSYQQAPAKNLIKSMFCDNCPLYWYHRLCCDVESLPAEASKTIILRRIDSSLSEKEQDEVYSRFSEFNIDSIEEHNEIFMSILRHQCERKQLKHGQSPAHLSALARQASLARQQSNLTISTSQSMVENAHSYTSTRASSASRAESFSNLNPNQQSFSSSVAQNNTTNQNQHHQRSGSTSGSLANMLAQQAGNHLSLADASSAYIDNLKRAKNTISVSIENMLKRRPSIKDDQDSMSTSPPADASQLTTAGAFPTRSGSFKGISREYRGIEQQQQQDNKQQADHPSSICELKRSQSTNDYSQQSRGNCGTSTSWRDSFSRTLNESADLSANNPFVGFFRRRGSKSGQDQQAEDYNQQQRQSAKVSTESLSISSELQAHPQSIGGSGSPIMRPQSNQPGGASPSSMLSGVFWKKSIFDKIRQPVVGAMGWTDEQTDGGKDQQHQQQEQQQEQQLPHQVNEQLQPKEVNEPRRHRTREELRGMWKKAILEQITLLKMEKQNKKLQTTTTKASASMIEQKTSGNSATITSNELSKIEMNCCGNNIQGIKLNYRDVPYGREAPQLWDLLLKQDPTKKVAFIEVARLVRLGVPKQLRGEAWMFLMNQYQLRHGTSFQPADREFHGDANQTYRNLLSQLSTQQHEIFVDIGRTFPTHPYYSQYLSIGQLSLFNLLKAYSLLDQEVGYCQGLSFVAGILLLHVDSEDEAFELMRHLLFNFGLRKQYLPSMNALHLQLYQITRLLRDHEYDLFNHFDNHDISPSLYAAPWFLTLFASQFPLGFVARLLDLIFLIGIEAIFRVSLTLLAYHRSSILKCSCLEATMEFMKRELVRIDDKNLSRIFDKAISLDLRNKLIEYEIEYSFYCAEEKARASQSLPLSKSISASSNNPKDDLFTDDTKKKEIELNESTSRVADATATVIIQHLLANNHLKSLRSNYSY